MGKRKRQIAAMSNSILVKDRHKKHGHRTGDDSFLHTTELSDGVGYNRINFQSVTEQNNLEDFLTTAEMAGKDFTAERQNIQIITNPGQGIQLTDADMQNISEAQQTHKALLQIPRRPKWDETTTKEELILMERDSFTDWRRQLKMLEEKEHIQLTPYEKNLDFWRQLWRVIERSDVIVQIVDARNPLLFRCEDLDIYVKEVDPRKAVMLLINKADYLTLQQRKQWVEFFNKEGIRAVFFSAKTEKEKQEGPSGTAESSTTTLDEDKDIDEYDDDDDDDDDDESDIEEEDEEGTDEDDSMDTRNVNPSHIPTESVSKSSSNSDHAAESHEDLDSRTPVETALNKLTVSQTAGDSVTASDKAVSPTPDSSFAADSAQHNRSRKIQEDGDIAVTELTLDNSVEIRTADELLDIFRKLAQPLSSTRADGVKTIGMVGYPNVGKSSTINVILNQKKLAVSATPGRTKHLQTLFVDEELMLCDCPGLVFPSFVATKAHLVINGILPIDEMRDHVSPINLICDLIPRDALEATYSIIIPRPSLDDNPDRKPTAEELLNAYGAMRGFMTARGVPDGPRSSRYILKDYVKGKLLYCEPPPGISGPEFQDKERITALQNLRPVSKLPPRQARSDIDKEFFAQKHCKAHSRGKTGVSDFVRVDTLQHVSRNTDASVSGSIAGSQTSLNSVAGKSWKKHNNRKKKEKLRRLHRDLDD